jgi:hypothetical protein
MRLKQLLSISPELNVYLYLVLFVIVCELLNSLRSTQLVLILTL